MAAMAQEREDAEEVAVRFECRDGRVGFGQRTGDRLRVGLTGPVTVISRSDS